MNEAWISARAGMAVVVTPADYFVLKAGGSEGPRECAPGQLNNLRGLATDVARMEAETFPFTKVQQTLDASWRQESALTLVLMALDRQLSLALRAEVADIAARLFSDDATREVVRRRLLGTPLPDVADVKRAPLHGVAEALVAEALAKRDQVSAATDAWDRTAFQYQLDGRLSLEDSARLRQACILRGGFAALVDTLHTTERARFVHWMKEVEDEGGEIAGPAKHRFLDEWALETSSRLGRFQARHLSLPSDGGRQAPRRRSRADASPATPPRNVTQSRKTTGLRKVADSTRTQAAAGARRTIISGNQNSGLIVGGDIRGDVTSGNISRHPTKEAVPLPGPALRILFLGASPKGAPALRLDQEVREIDQALRQADFRDRFDLRQQLALRPVDLQSALLRHRPQIVHFSGHGEVNGILLEDDTGQLRRVQGSVVARIFGVFKKQIRCVVLNTCYSRDQAEAIAQDIDCVVGMSQAIGDQAAIRFAGAFYQALAYGSSVKMAFDLGGAQVDLVGLAEGTTPQLIALRQDPGEIFFGEERPELSARPPGRQDVRFAAIARRGTGGDDVK